MESSHAVVDPTAISHAQPEESERKARVDAVWKQMNKGISMKTYKSISNKPMTTINKAKPKSSYQKNSASWMTYLGVGPKKVESSLQDKREKQTSPIQSGTSEEAKKLAAAALSAVRDAAVAASGKGKIEIKEVRDFAGQEIEVKTLVDADSEKAKAVAAPSSAVDAILEQIKKKQKLSVLDKTKKDWGEYKEEHKGVEDELETYKKSSNKYSDKVSFLERTDYREFERERDARLAVQAKRRTDMKEDDD